MGGGKTKSLKSKGRRNKTAGGSLDGSVGVFGSPLHFCFAERESIFKVNFSTISQADQGGKAKVLGLSTYSQRRRVCTRASAA